ncbi:hypothetical protein AJ79_05091 [Helicocarpus griseus UAMH5409]|uniref:ARID domain-containing protein n=1 Tax=Helicocarpus griseus UAMH5409 TaxID=1447875 RepID=A0A2B7XQ15_9EURO|nr:hypothetical protein AJ79_05091 [Helicocarpus griseus UAMH5409]
MNPDYGEPSPPRDPAEDAPSQPPQPPQTLQSLPTLDQMRTDVAAFQRSVREVLSNLDEAPSPLPFEGSSFYWEVNRKKVDPHQLFLEVINRGGFHTVSRDKDNWCEIAGLVGIPDSQTTTLSWNVKDLYSRWLLPLEAAMNGPSQPDGDARSARGLRRAPPQRQSYTATSPATRQTRSGANPPAVPANLNNSHPPVNSSSPAASARTTTSVNDGSANIASEEARSTMTTFIVDTPSNRRGKFSRPDQPPLTNTMDPLLIASIPEKTPRIYNHCVKGLQCGVPSEIDFALHHLVVISDERGDKFKFDDFPFLAEELIEKVLDLTFLITAVSWEVDYIGFEKPRDNLIYGYGGNTNLRERTKRLSAEREQDLLTPGEYDVLAKHVKEAALTLRNMSMLEANAVYLADLEVFKDCMIILFNIPRQRRFNEVINCMLDTVEQVCPYWETDPDDDLYQTLMDFLGSRDRYHILTGLKILILFSMDLDTSKRLEGVPDDKVQMLMSYVLLEQDKELLSGTLDFLYQYTALPENVEDLITKYNLPTTLIPRMVNLLLFEGEQDINEIVDQEERKAPPAEAVPIVPPELHSLLLHFNEPERCSRWLKCCFIEDEECEITQLALWHAYQNCFADERGGVNTLPAAEFINTVSRTFSSAQAQVVPGAVAKFIIRGIRPLETAYDMNGYPYHHCQWRIPMGQCTTAFIDPAKLKEHVFREHMVLDMADLDNLQNARRPTNACTWGDCQEYIIPTVNTARVAGHVSTHLPPLRDMSSPPPVPPRRIIQPKLTRLFDYYPTPVDEKGEPVGIAYKALLILRNIIRNLPRGSAGPKNGNKSWNYVLFFSSRRKIIEMADLNPTLRADMFDLANEIKSS